MITIKELKSVWKNMNTNEEGYLLVSGGHPLAFHVGYNANHQMCFVVLDTGQVASITSSKAIEAECLTMKNGDAAICFSLKFQELDDLFIKLCWDLMDSSKDSSTPIASILKQYQKWLLLLRQAENNSVLSQNRIKGLIGELLFLNSLLDTMDEDNAVASWVGPDGEDQDFVWNNNWAEIKTTTISSNEVTISSLQQLDREDEGKLVVYHMDKTDSSLASNISLLSVIEMVKDNLRSASNKDIIDCKIARLGYLERDNKIYEKTKFKLDSVEEFDVNNMFPKLVKTSVPRGILNAKYILDLEILRLNKGK